MTLARPERDKLHRGLQRLDFTRQRMERLFAASEINKTDLESVYEALFLRAVTSFEGFLEDLFLAILDGRTRYVSSRVQLRMEAKSKEALMEILLQGNAYMNWLPFVHAEKRAKLYLKDGRPFTDLTDGDKSQIKTIATIRNAIAHKSPHAKAEFEKHVIGSLPLLNVEKKPAGFLRSRVSSQPNQTRFEVYVSTLGRIAGVLS